MAQSTLVRPSLPSTHSTASFASFFWLLVRRDLKVRYAGSTLGGLWNLIHPLMLIAIYMIIFSSLMPNGGAAMPGYPRYGPLTYGVHLCAGLIPWLLFSDVLLRSTGVLIENSNFLQKVSFPPLVLFLSVLFNALLVQGASYLLFMVILLCMGYALPPAVFGAFGIMILFGLAAMGLGLILSGMNVFFRDIAQILAVAMQFLFWFNPIVYLKEDIFRQGVSGANLPLRRLAMTLITINPLERFITACQSFFGVTHAPTSANDWLIILLTPVVCLVVGLLLFRRMLPDVRDCL